MQRKARARFARTVRRPVRPGRLADPAPREVVLGPDRWPAWLQPLVFDTALLRITNVTRIREWLVAPETANLSIGQYALEIAWNGTAFAPGSLLPAGGTLTAPTLELASNGGVSRDSTESLSGAWTAQRFAASADRATRCAGVEERDLRTSSWWRRARFSRTKFRRDFKAATAR